MEKVLLTLNRSQAPIYEDELIFKRKKDTFRMRLPADLVWTTNRYVWYKDGELLETSDGNTGSLDFKDLKEEDSRVYHCEVSNKDLDNLSLTSNIFALHVDDMSESISFIDSMVVETEKSSFSNLIFPGRLFPNGKVSSTFKIMSNTGDLDMSKSELQIFNATGQLVYLSKSYNNNWQGTAMDTENLLPAGVYFYAFRLNNIEYQVESGTFTLIL